MAVSKNSVQSFSYNFSSLIHALPLEVLSGSNDAHCKDAKYYYKIFVFSRQKFELKVTLMPFDE